MVVYDIDPLSLGILLAINSGIKDVKRIAEYLNVDEESVKETLEELKDKGLVKEDKKKVLFFEVKDLKLTREGYNTLMTALQKLKPKLEELKNIHDEEQLYEALGALGLGLLAPLLIPLILGGFLLPIGIGFGAAPHHGSHIRPGEPF